MRTPRRRNIFCTSVPTDCGRPATSGAREGAVRRACLLLACVLLPLDARAQGPATTFRSSIDVVALNVVVTDQEQKFVTGLRAQDFAVYEDGFWQDLSFFAASAIPLDLAIMLDTSASMSDKIDT